MRRTILPILFVAACPNLDSAISVEMGAIAVAPEDGTTAHTLTVTVDSSDAKVACDADIIPHFDLQWLGAEGADGELILTYSNERGRTQETSRELAGDDVPLLALGYHWDRASDERCTLTEDVLVTASGELRGDIQVSLQLYGRDLNEHRADMRIQVGITAAD